MKLQISISTDTRNEKTQLYFIKPEKVFYNGKEIRAIFRIVPIADNILSQGSKVDGTFALDVPGTVKAEKIDIWLLSDLPIYADSANIIPTRSLGIISTDGYCCIYDHNEYLSKKSIAPQSIFEKKVMDSFDTACEDLASVALMQH